MLSVVDGILYSNDLVRRICCPAGLERNPGSIPDGIALIGNRAFYRRATLEQISKPGNIALSDGMHSITVPYSCRLICLLTLLSSEVELSLTVPPESAFQKTSADLYLLPDSDTEIMKTASKDEITSLMKKTILR